MSTPVLRPPRVVDAPAANPAAHQGLYTAATVVDVPDPARLSFGLTVRQTNCLATGRWAPGCIDPDAAARKDGRRAADKDSLTTVVYAAYRCRQEGITPTELTELSAQAMRLREHIEVEDFIAPRLLTDAAPVGAALPLARALGAVEEAIAGTGMTGVVHAPVSLAAAAAAAHLLVPNATGQLTTPLGNRWAFGAGYGDLGPTLVGTGPAWVWRSTINTVAAWNMPTGEQLVVAEREVSVSWECVTAANAVTL